MVFSRLAMKTTEGHQQEEPCACSEPGHLGEIEDAEWLEALIDDQANKVQSMLDAASDSRKACLLNSHFKYNDGHVSHHLHGSCFRLRLPLTLAMAVGAHKIVEILLREGADPSGQDCHGNNVAHSMVMHTFYNPEMEDTALESFAQLVKLLSEDDLRKILLSENVYGLRPLEFAAQHGTCRLMTAIMEIPGVYLYREERHGLTTYQWYDVTDYEASAERFSKSPLLLVSFVDSKVMDTAGFHAMHCKKLMKQWLDAKLRTNIPFIVLLLVFRVLYIAGYIALDMDTSFYGEYIHGNTTEHCRPHFAPVLSFMARSVLRTILMVCAVFVLLVDLVEVCLTLNKRYWQLTHTVEGRKNWQVQVKFYKWSNFIFSSFVLVYGILGFFPCGCFKWFYDVSRVICPILAVWNVLYFLQLLPSIGTFVITIQTILEDLMNFSIVYIFFMIPFMHSFQTIINTNTNVGCMENFDQMFRIMYSLFITMLNMIDYTSYDVRNPEILLVAHVAYTFVVSIMMINFFIALLSNSVTRTTSRTSYLLCFQRCSVAMLLERRCQWLFTAVYLRLKKRYFQFEDGRFFIVQVKSDCCNKGLKR